MMGLGNWWKAPRAKAESCDVNEDQVLIGARVPELAGLTSVEGVAHSLQQFVEWNSTCTVEQGAEVAGLVAASRDRWRAQGLRPYWSDLWVLRRYQASSATSQNNQAPD